MVFGETPDTNRSSAMLRDVNALGFYAHRSHCAGRCSQALSKLSLKDLWSDWGVAKVTPVNAEDLDSKRKLSSKCGILRLFHVKQNYVRFNPGISCLWPRFPGSPESCDSAAHLYLLALDLGLCWRACSWPSFQIREVPMLSGGFPFLYQFSLWNPPV